MTLEEERVQFFAALGEALDQWARVENALCCIFMVCLRAPHRRTAAAFFAVENFRSKLNMVDSVVRLTGVDAAKVHEWEALHKRFNRKSRLRNQLAHYEVFEDASAETASRFTLRAKILDPRSPSLFEAHGPGILRISDLRERRLGFSQLAEDTQRFYGELCKLLGMPPSST
jgi:hypothetical protein